MKLRKVNFYLDWPVSIEVIDLRKYVMKNLIKEGDVIRWSIVDIQYSRNSYSTKAINIQAVFAN